MVEKFVTIKTVQEAILRLESQGERPSNRNIRRILGGGSPNEIQGVLQQIRDANGAGITLPIELPVSMQTAILSGIHFLIAETTSCLRAQIEELRMAQADGLDELEGAQARVADLQERDRQAQDRLKIAGQRSDSLLEQLEGLRVERKQLIEAGETARLDAAKAQIQAERADQAAQNAEERLKNLGGQLEVLRNDWLLAEKALSKQLAEADKKAAVAEQRALDLEQLLSHLQVDQAKCV